MKVMSHDVTFLLVPQFFSPGKEIMVQALPFHSSSYERCWEWISESLPNNQVHSITFILDIMYKMLY